ncbi:MAG: lysophospholipase [Caulobacter sp. 35-67-4]|nr:MAG: lysophospholipase [Caulobacter sp. 32-67-35]OYX91549.1 MAG: lysophospholipase [Caulobacter sp. 35-67-4]
MRRPLLAILFFLTLAGCGQDGARAPFAESRTPPSIAPRFYAPDGWAWGYVRVGAGLVQRYGVSAPPVAPRATVVILTGYGEPAEKWFETVRRLNMAGYAAWVLERQGQGGSERATPWRDLGHLDSFETDAAALRALVKVVIRPSGETPLVVLGHSDGAVVALRAVQTGLPTDGLMLSSPAFALNNLPHLPTDPRQTTLWASRLKLGWLKAPGAPGWRRDGQGSVALGLTSDRLRGAVQQAWLTANPDLRIGAPSLGWMAALYEAADRAQAEAARVRAPVLLLRGGEDRLTASARATSACVAFADCRNVTFPGGRHELHMESDAVREAWLGQVEAFVRARILAKAPRHKG